MWKTSLCLSLLTICITACSGAQSQPEAGNAPPASTSQGAMGNTPIVPTLQPASSPTTPPTPTEAVEPDAATDPLSGATAQPARFGEGVISSEAEEWGISFTPDGHTAYFARSDAFFPQSRQATILETRWDGERWSQPVVASFSGQWSDIDPFVSPDGSRLYFASIRPVEGVERTDLNLWMVERVADRWGAPVYLGDGVNSERDELYPSVTADGVLYFGSDRPAGHGGWDIYRAAPDESGTYPVAENLGVPVNSAAWEFNPTIFPDGSQLLFTALNRPGGVGAGDIYLSRNTISGWSEPEPLGPLVNSAADEYHPRLSPRGDILFFVRRERQGDLFYVRWDAVRP